MVYIGIYWDISPLPIMEIYMEHQMEDCMEAKETCGCIRIVPLYKNSLPTEIYFRDHPRLGSLGSSCSLPAGADSLGERRSEASMQNRLHRRNGVVG